MQLLSTSSAPHRTTTTTITKDRSYDPAPTATATHTATPVTMDGTGAASEPNTTPTVPTPSSGTPSARADSTTGFTQGGPTLCNGAPDPDLCGTSRMPKEDCALTGEKMYDVTREQCPVMCSTCANAATVHDLGVHLAFLCAVWDKYIDLVSPEPHARYSGVLIR